MEAIRPIWVPAPIDPLSLPLITTATDPAWSDPWLTADDRKAWR